jgi:hypothetical protein
MKGVESLPDYPGNELSSASKAIQLLQYHSPDSIVETFTQTIVERYHEKGLKGLTESEAHLAALQTYQTAIAWDGFGSIYYNNGDLVPTMLAATKQSGAEVAHTLLVRGLSLLGLKETAGGLRIRWAGQRIVAAISLVAQRPKLNEIQGARNDTASNYGEAAQRVLRALGLADTRKERATRLLNAFETLDEEFNHRVPNFGQEMLSILTSPTSDLSNFP